MEVRAAVAVGAGKPLEVTTVRLEGPRAFEVLVEIKATGICHTDEFTLSGADPEGLFPAILGHEGAGVVVEVGPGVTTLKPGDHVIPLYTPECRQCKSCLSGKTNLCTAIRAGNLAAVRLLLATSKCDPNKPGIIPGGAVENDGDWGTPAMHALRAFLFSATYCWYCWKSCSCCRWNSSTSLTATFGRPPRCGQSPGISRTASSSGGFFALHTATRPYKIPADNAFRAATEVHIFLMIATSLVLRGLEDGAKEVAAYDWTLFVSFVVLLPCGHVNTCENCARQCAPR